VDNARALPTARAFAHMPTAFDHGEIKNSKPNTRVRRQRFSLPHHVTEIAGHSIRHERGGET
jgi:hypothetical protein